jgi:hypothetical protein
VDRLGSVENAKFLIQNFGGWFGPPAIRAYYAGGEVLDGRLRLQAWRELGRPTSGRGRPPTQLATTSRQAGRLLLLAHHVDRAAALLGDSIPYGPDTAALLHVPPEVGAMLVQHVRRQRAKPRPAPRRRAVVVRRLRRLLFEVVDDGRQVTAQDLREVLGDWA